MSTDSKRLTSEDISGGSVGILQPLMVQFSPGNVDVATFLFPDLSGTGGRQIYRIDVSDSNVAAHQDVPFTPMKLLDTASLSNSDSTLSLQEQLQRERMRLFGQGLSTYEWAATVGNDSSSSTCGRSRLLAPSNGSIIIYENNAAKVIFPNDNITLPISRAVDPHLSPNGSAVAFVSDDDLYFMNIPDDIHAPMPNPYRLTVNGAQPGITCGLADYVAQEEMDRYRGFWWSNDSKMIAYTEADESHIPEYQILHQGKANPAHSETHRYPFAGAANPKVKLAVTHLPSSSAPGNTIIWMDLIGDAASSPFDAQDYYLARVGWWPDGSVMAQVENRRQTVLQLLKLDPYTGVRTVMVEEKSDMWINLHNNLFMFSSDWTPSNTDSGSSSNFYFIWASERNGFSQLYMYRHCTTDATTHCMLDGNPIGGGDDWIVDTIDDVDESRELVYFSGNKGDPTQRHLYVASFKDSEGSKKLIQVTTEPGWHTATVSAKRKLVIDSFNSMTQVSVMHLHRLTVSPASAPLSVQSQLVSVILECGAFDTRLAGIKPCLKVPEIHHITCPQSGTKLVTALYLPDAAVFGPGPYPTIVSIYGGPHAQMICQKWNFTSDMRAQRLAQDGFLVLKCDNRGSARRGLQFEGALRWDMGNIEIKDQQTAIEAFAAKQLVDINKVGIYGWSYGGYMSAMCLFRAPETFRCAVAGAPVTSWDGYDTHYTERYMGLPQENIDGYNNSSVMNHVANRPSQRLMLVHGLIDENVHFRHTARLINKLIECRSRYDLILFPCERHGPQKKEDRIYLEDRICEYFVESLSV